MYILLKHTLISEYMDVPLVLFLKFNRCFYSATLPPVQKVTWLSAGLGSCLNNAILSTLHPLKTLICLAQGFMI